MGLTHLVKISALCSLLATSALVYSQEQRQEPRRAPEPSPEAAQPSQDEMKTHPEEAKPEKQNENNKAEEKASRQENTNTKDTKNEAARSGQEKHAANQRGARIPADKFRASFGRQHKFTIKRTTVNGQSGFRYGGYSFVIVDAWPVGWAYTDDCYIDDIDGEYFLFDLLHPGVQIALVVVL